MIFRPGGIFVTALLEHQICLGDFLKAQRLLPKLLKRLASPISREVYFHLLKQVVICLVENQELFLLILSQMKGPLMKSLILLLLFGHADMIFQQVEVLWFMVAPIPYSLRPIRSTTSYG